MATGGDNGGVLGTESSASCGTTGTNLLADKLTGSGRSWTDDGKETGHDEVTGFKRLK